MRCQIWFIFCLHRFQLRDEIFREYLHSLPRTPPNPGGHHVMLNHPLDCLTIGWCHQCPDVTIFPRSHYLLISEVLYRYRIPYIVSTLSPHLADTATNCRGKEGNLTIDKTKLIDNSSLLVFCDRAVMVILHSSLVSHYQRCVGRVKSVTLDKRPHWLLQ